MMRVSTRRRRAIAMLTLLAAVAVVAPSVQAQGRGAVRAITLSSPSFTDGGAIPAKHTQSGRDVSPPLAWSGAPDSVRSYVLLMHDLDAVTADGHDPLPHWMVWNIPGTATSLPEGIPSGAPREGGMRQMSVSGPYYRGPAAPSDGPMHHYVFELYALDITINVPAEGLSASATRDALRAAMAGHVRGKGVLVGLYRRPAP